MSFGTVFGTVSKENRSTRKGLAVGQGLFFRAGGAFQAKRGLWLDWLRLAAAYPLMIVLQNLQVVLTFDLFTVAEPGRTDESWDFACPVRGAIPPKVP